MAFYLQFLSLVPYHVFLLSAIKHRHGKSPLECRILCLIILPTCTYRMICLAPDRLVLRFLIS